MADELFSWSITFVSRLSARYSRLLANRIMDASSELLEYCIKAQEVYPGNYNYAKMREFYLTKAYGALCILDVMLRHTYDVLMLNPQGAFSKTNGNSVPETEALEKLDKMCANIGNLINKEKGLLIGIKKVTHDKIKSFKNSEPDYEDFSDELEGQIKLTDFEFELVE